MRLVVALLIAMAFPAFAEDDVKCNEAGTQLEMTRCASDDFVAADKELNLAYQAKMRGLKPDEKTALRTQQRAWLQKLRPDCKKQATDEAGNGSMWSLIHLSCMADATRKRTAALKAE